MLVFGGGIYIYIYEKNLSYGYFCFFLGTKSSSKINMAASKVHTVKLVMSTALGEPENIKVSSRLTAGWVLPPKKIKDDEIPTISVDCVVLGDTCDD